MFKEVLENAEKSYKMPIIVKLQCKKKCKEYDKIRFKEAKDAKKC